MASESSIQSKSYSHILSIHTAVSYKYNHLREPAHDLRQVLVKVGAREVVVLRDTVQSVQCRQRQILEVWQLRAGDRYHNMQREHNVIVWDMRYNTS